MFLPQISGEFQCLSPMFQEVIADITCKMGVGMTVFLEDQVDSMLQWDEVLCVCVWRGACYSGMRYSVWRGGGGVMECLGFHAEGS